MSSHRSEQDAPGIEPVAEPAVRWRLREQDALQGVRAVAVLAVFVFHLGELPGGWLGVEAFFVLSGFLITLILLGQHRDATYSAKRFYLRRAGRLLPATFLVLAVVLTYSLATDYSVKIHLVGAAATLLYAGNFIHATGGEMGLLGHIWSLSIEEQFYFLWPLALAAAARAAGAVRVAWVAGVGFLLSIGARVIVTGHGGDWFDRVYYATDTRAAGLLIGCLAGALLFHSRGKLAARVPMWLCWISTAGIALGLLIMDGYDLSTWRFGVTLFDVAVAVLLVGLVDADHLLARLLSLKPLVYVGTISYGLYLWHLPVIAIADVELTGPTRMAAQVAVPFVLAVLSYHLAESPIRSWVRRRA